MNNAMEIKNFCKSYKRVLLEDISFNVPEGFITGLVGSSGVGKTTIINAALGQIKCDTGSCKVFGKDLFDNPVVRQDIGIVPDELVYARHLTPIEVEKQIAPFYSNWDFKSYKSYLDRFSLPIDKKLEDYSKGMQMKYMLAVALSHSPRLLVLDEPTSGYDLTSREDLLLILSDFISEGEKTVLYSTHSVSDLEIVADYMTVISQGKLKYTGSKEDLIEKYRVVKIPAEAAGYIKDFELIGIVKTIEGFKAMIETVHIDLLPTNFALSHASLEEIIYYFEKEKNE